MNECEHGQVSWLSCSDCIEEAAHKQMERIAELEAENGELRRKVERLEKWQDALRQRLHMAEEQIRECRQYLRLDDRNLVVGHIDAYFALPALVEGKEDG